MTQIVQKHLSTPVFLGLIICLGTLTPLSIDMYLPALGDMVVELGTTEAIMNMTLYGFMFTMAVSILAFGPLIDKYGRKIPLIFCMVEFAAASLLCAVSTGIEMLIVFRIMQAVGAGGGMTISTALIKDTYSGPMMAKVLNILAVMGVLAPIIAPILGSFLITAWGWRSTFIVPMILSLVLAAVSLLMTESLPDDERVNGGMRVMLKGMKGLLADKDMSAFMMLFCIFHMPFMAYVSVSSYIYQGMFGMEPTTYSLVLGGAVLVSIVIMTVLARLTRGVVNKKMIPVYLVLSLLGTVGILFLGPMSWILFFATNLFIMVTSFSIRPWGMSIMMRSHPGDSGAMSALINFMFSLLGTVGMVLVTLPWGDYVFAVGVLNIISTAVYFLMMIYLKRRGNRIRELEGTPAGQDVAE